MATFSAIYLQGMICHSSYPKSSLLTRVMAVHSTNHALTAVIMILKDRNSLFIKIKINNINCNTKVTKY